MRNNIFPQYILNFFSKTLKLLTIRYNKRYSPSFKWVNVMCRMVMVSSFVFFCSFPETFSVKFSVEFCFNNFLFLTAFLFCRVFVIIPEEASSIIFSCFFFFFSCSSFFIFSRGMFLMSSSTYHFYVIYFVFICLIRLEHILQYIKNTTRIHYIIGTLGTNNKGT